MRLILVLGVCVRSFLQFSLQDTMTNQVHLKNNQYIKNGRVFYDFVRFFSVNLDNLVVLKLHKLI